MSKERERERENENHHQELRATYLLGCRGYVPVYVCICVTCIICVCISVVSIYQPINKIELFVDV